MIFSHIFGDITNKMKECLLTVFNGQWLYLALQIMIWEYKFKIQKDLNWCRVGSLATTVPVFKFIEFELRLKSPKTGFN